MSLSISHVFICSSFTVILEKQIRIPRSLSVKAASVLKGFLNKVKQTTQINVNVFVTWTCHSAVIIIVSLLYLLTSVLPFLGPYDFHNHRITDGIGKLKQNLVLMWNFTYLV